MRALPTPVTRRDADNELFDHGCDLVVAARAIRRAAGAPEAARAVPAVLGCVESALRELMAAAAALEQTSTEFLDEAAIEESTRRTRAVSERMQRGFANLQLALADGECAAAAARSLAGRALTSRSSVGAARRRRA